jgi:hypothetical protein
MKDHEAWVRDRSSEITQLPGITSFAFIIHGNVWLSPWTQKPDPAS